MPVAANPLQNCRKIQLQCFGKKKSKTVLSILYHTYYLILNHFLLRIFSFHQNIQCLDFMWMLKKFKAGKEIITEGEQTAHTLVFNFLCIHSTIIQCVQLKFYAVCLIFRCSAQNTMKKEKKWKRIWAKRPFLMCILFIKEPTTPFQIHKNICVTSVFALFATTYMHFTLSIQYLSNYL